MDRKEYIILPVYKTKGPGDECEIRGEHPENDRLEPRSEENSTGRR